MINKETLVKILPTCKNPDIWYPLLNQHLNKAGIESKEQIAHFLSQTGHESHDYNILEENLNYSAERLLVIFPKYFKNMSPEVLKTYDRNPEAIANKVYGGRMGNTEPGDGFKFKGRGIIQLTGRSNYSECSKFIFGNDNLLNDPGLLLIHEYALLSALWFWKKNNLSTINNVAALTKRINGGDIGLADRQSRFETALRLL